MGLLHTLRSLPKRSFLLLLIFLLVLPIAVAAATGNQPLYSKIAPAKSCITTFPETGKNMTADECSQRNTCIGLALHEDFVSPGFDHDYHILRGGLWQFFQKQKQFREYGEFGYGCFGGQDIMKVELYLL